MNDKTAKKLPLIEIGNSAFLNVLRIDRGPLDTKNIARNAVDFGNGVYKIGTSSGIIKNWFYRQDLQVSSKDYCTSITELREAVNSQGLKQTFVVNIK